MDKHLSYPCSKVTFRNLLWITDSEPLLADEAAFLFMP